MHSQLWCIAKLGDYAEDRSGTPRDYALLLMPCDTRVSRRTPPETIDGAILAGLAADTSQAPSVVRVTRALPRNSSKDTTRGP